MIANEFHLEGDDNTHICVVTFSTQAHVDIKLNQYHSAETLMQNVLRVPYRYDTLYSNGWAVKELLTYMSHRSMRVLAVTNECLVANGNPCCY